MSEPNSSLRTQGMEALRAGRIDDAVDLLARVVMADHGDAEARALLGIAYSQKGMHTQGIRALETATELQPQNVNFRFNLGVVQERAGNADAAIDHYCRVLRMQPQHAQARARLQAMGPAGAAALANMARPQQPAPPPGGAPGAPGAPSPGGYAGGGLGASNAAPGPPPGYPPGVPPQQPHGTPPGAGSFGGSPYGAKSPAPYTGTYPPPPDPGYGYAPDMSTGEAFFRRFAAALIDGVLLNVIAVIVALPIGIVLGLSQAASPGAGLEVASNLIGFVVGITVSVIYYGGLLSTRGQTVGKMALGLRVIDANGQNPTFWQGAIRDTLGKMISGLLCLVGYLWMLWDPDQQTLHDKMAGTRVIRA